MSSMGWPDDGMDGDWSFLGSDPGSPQLPQGIIPVTVAPSQTPSIIPMPPQDQSTVFVPLSAYGPPPVLQDPNAGAPPNNGTPSAEGVANALKYSGWGQDAATLLARQVARLGSGDPSVVNGLEGATRRYLTGPLAAGEAVAGTISDIHQGTSPLDAAVGNIARGVMVYGGGVGAGALTDGWGGIPASMALDHYLPPAPQIGHAITQGIFNLPNLYPAYDPASLEAFGG